MSYGTGAPRRGDASKANGAGRRRDAVSDVMTAKEAAP